MKSQYPQATQAILNWIAKQNLRPGTSLPSARLLGEQIGFSRLTTGLACNVLISNGALYRKGYKLFVGSGNAPRAPIEGIVYVVSYWDRFLKTAERILTGRGVKCRCVSFNSIKHTKPLPALRKLFSEKPAGLILWMPYWMDGLQAALESEKTPMVICTDGVPPEVKLNVVATDIYRSAEKAVEHLVDLGHRHIACVPGGQSGVAGRDFIDSYRKVCLQLGLKTAASAIWQADSAHPEALRHVMQEEHQRHPEVTAIFAYGRSAAIAMEIFQVPEKLSLVGLFARAPRLTTVYQREEEESPALWACSDLIAQIQTLEGGLPPKRPRRTFFVPELIVEQSTRSLKSKKPEIKVPGPKAAPPPRSDLRPASPWESWRKPYPFLTKSGLRNWRQLDLSKLANHSITREHGWLGGEPLLHFDAGLRSLHGVPFQVIDERLNSGRAVVTFHSPHAHTTHNQTLPTTVELPLDGCVKAIYFLHGCGNARPTAFAKYTMHFKNGTASTVPLIALGPSRQLAMKRLGKLKPNLQDWWLGFEQCDFPHAKHAVIFDPANPETYERYLYTLEWINPHPQEELSHIKVRVNPKAGPTLALIAVTALV